MSMREDPAAIQPDRESQEIDLQDSFCDFLLREDRESAVLHDVTTLLSLRAALHATDTIYGQVIQSLGKLATRPVSDTYWIEVESNCGNILRTVALALTRVRERYPLSGGELSYRDVACVLLSRVLELSWKPALLRSSSAKIVDTRTTTDFVVEYSGRSVCLFHPPLPCQALYEFATSINLMGENNNEDSISSAMASHIMPWLRQALHNFFQPQNCDLHAFLCGRCAKKSKSKNFYSEDVSLHGFRSAEQAANELRLWERLLTRGHVQALFQHVIIPELWRIYQKVKERSEATNLCDLLPIYPPLSLAHMIIPWLAYSGDTCEQLHRSGITEKMYDFLCHSLSHPKVFNNSSWKYLSIRNFLCPNALTKLSELQIENDLDSNNDSSGEDIAPASCSILYKFSSSLLQRLITQSQNPEWFISVLQSEIGSMSSNFDILALNYVEFLSFLPRNTRILHLKSVFLPVYYVLIREMSFPNVKILWTLFSEIAKAFCQNDEFCLDPIVTQTVRSVIHEFQKRAREKTLASSTDEKFESTVSKDALTQISSRIRDLCEDNAKSSMKTPSADTSSEELCSISFYNALVSGRIVQCLRMLALGYGIPFSQVPKSVYDKTTYFWGTTKEVCIIRHSVHVRDVHDKRSGFTPCALKDLLL